LIWKEPVQRRGLSHLRTGVLNGFQAVHLAFGAAGLRPSAFEQGDVERCRSLTKMKRSRLQQALQGRLRRAV